MPAKNYKKIYSNNTLCQSPYDKRDYKFKDLVGNANIEIPTKYETPDLGWTYDQKDSSMCAPSAYCYIRCLQEYDKEQSELTGKVSPSFHYANRDIGHNHEGMHLRNLCSRGRDGSVLFDRMTYPNTFEGARAEFFANEEKLRKEAKPFRITKYYTCRSRKEVQQAIMTTKSVLIGVPVYDSFYRPNSEGYIEYHQGEVFHGNHAIVIDGWKTIEGKLYWRIKNSWGKTWGHLGNGHAYLSEEYPWMDNAYVIVDEVTEMKFKEYQEQLNRPQVEQASLLDIILAFFRKLFKISD